MVGEDGSGRRVQHLPGGAGSSVKGSSEGERGGLFKESERDKGKSWREG